MEGVTITLPGQRSAESGEFVFKIRRRLVNHNFMCTYTSDDQIMIPISIPERALNNMYLETVTARAAWY